MRFLDLVALVSIPIDSKAKINTYTANTPFVSIEM